MSTVAAQLAQLAKKSTMNSWIYFIEFGNKFCFRPVADGQRGYMTADGKEVAVGDYVFLPGDDGHSRYRVKEVRYYPDEPNRWHGKVEFAPQDRPLRRPTESVI